jgi:hypothetical protein
MFLRGLTAGTLAVMVALVSLPGPAGAVAAGWSRPDAHVYLFRGLMNIWSLGLDDLAQKMRRRGIPATVFNHLEARTVAMQAIADYRARRVRHVVIVGHSWGSDAALRMARILNDAHVPVDLVVTYEASYGSIVSSNVRKVVNFYLSTGLGSPIAPGRNFHGVLRNIDEAGNPHIGHFNMDKVPVLHRKVIALTLSAIDSRTRR